jgi:hypothetical protein
MERYVEFIFYEDTGKVIFRWRTEGRWADFLASRGLRATVPNIPKGEGPPNSLFEATHFELTELPLVIRGRINMLRLSVGNDVVHNRVPGVGYSELRRVRRTTESISKYIASITLGVCVDEEDIKQLREIYPPLVIEDEAVRWLGSD